MIYDLKFVQTNEGKKIISFNDDCIRYSYVNFSQAKMHKALELFKHHKNEDESQLSKKDNKKQ